MRGKKRTAIITAILMAFQTICWGATSAAVYASLPQIVKTIENTTLGGAAVDGLTVVLETNTGLVDINHGIKETRAYGDCYGAEITGDVVRNSNGNIIIPYNKTGPDSASINRMSVIVTDGTWTSAGRWSANARLLQYADVGTGEFALDTNAAKGVWGVDFHVYLLAEETIPDPEEYDMCSIPVEVPAPAGLYDEFKLNTYSLVLQKNTSRVVTADFGNSGNRIESVVSSNDNITASFSGNQITISANKASKGFVTVNAVSGGSLKSLKINVKVIGSKVVTKSIDVSATKLNVYNDGYPRFVKVSATPDKISTNEPISVSVTGKDPDCISAVYDETTGYISIYGNKPGNAKVEIVAGKKKASIKVKVLDHDFYLNTDSLTLKIGTSRNITATLYNDTLGSTTLKGINAKRKIAAINNNGGNITITAGYNSGSAKIVFKSKSGIKRQISVKVQKKDVVTKSIIASKSAVKLNLAEKPTMTVLITPKPDFISTEQPVIITQSEESAKIVNAVYNEYSRKITFTALSKGKTTLVVNVGKKTKKIKITVDD